ncbi:MAG: GNAT family N-acetyltransferase [Bacteroidales bacterium]|nr:GNAT family N-acetyltransferase [Bacteroidales bacterium]MDD4670727.1 GNAT family N-acetyltransferase [Bacteroidales bacterium]
MIRPATKQDYPSIRAICKECFTTDAKYLDLFFNHCPSKASFVYEMDGKIVSALHTIGISYVSSKRTNGLRTYYHGLYIYGVGTLKSYRNKGYSSSLINYISAGASKIGWDFLLLRPAEPRLIDFYQNVGFTTPIYRSNDLPLFENGAHISKLSAVELFKLRDSRLKSNYFQWSHIMLDYIIREAKINPPLPYQTNPTNIPYTLLKPLSKDFKLDSNSAIFSYPME